MMVIEYETNWLTLPNPFGSNTPKGIPGHVSGRSTDIAEIITGRQSAILLLGAPNIGKSTLIRYLQWPPTAGWSWRNELPDLRDQLNLNNIYFMQINLTPSEDVRNEDQLLHFFIKQCITALQPLYQEQSSNHSQDDQQPPLGPRDLYRLIRNIRDSRRGHPNSRYFVMLDTIESLDRPGMKLFDIATSRGKTPQERGIARLDQCGAIRTLVDLIDEFNDFGVILSIESLSRPSIDDQFTLISADLARFTTMTLQTFTQENTVKFLRQEPKDFGDEWAHTFEQLGGSYIFSEKEQTWLFNQAGTHPYLLQQFCFHTFNFKREYARLRNAWTDIKESDKGTIIELINRRLSTFLARIWIQLQEAFDRSSQKTRSTFYEFIGSLPQKYANEEIPASTWDNFGPELRYILSSEGLVRYDPFQTSYYPGYTLSQYLAQKVKESIDQRSAQPSISPSTGRGFWLTVDRPGQEFLSIPLTELEYRLLKTMLQYPDRCSELELMKGAWGKTVDRSAFTQRMHHLRKKLKERLGGIEVIENHYGGVYSLNHPEWFHLE